jgi:integron integrase
MPDAVREGFRLPLRLALNRSEVTQRQALNALVCFYKVLGHPLGRLPEWVRPKQRRRMPTWVTTSEALAIISHLREPWNEVASLLFGSGLRIGECLDLRVKDIDLERGTVTIRGGKGDKDRVTLLARSMVPELRRRLECSRAVWEEDRAGGRPGVQIPEGVARKYPRAGTEWPWFWLWPAPGESTDPESGIVRRHHRHEMGFSKALKLAVSRAKIGKRVTAHAFRHGFATAYLEGNGTVPELQELLGHAHIETTEIYTHCLPKLASRAVSPLDRQDTNITPIRRAI